MVQITEVNREPATTVSTLTATTEVTSPSVTADSASVTNAVDAGSVTTDALEATDEFVPPVVATESDLPDPANVPEGAETTVLSDPNDETSVYKVVDN